MRELFQYRKTTRIKDPLTLAGLSIKGSFSISNYDGSSLFLDGLYIENITSGGAILYTLNKKKAQSVKGLRFGGMGIFGSEGTATIIKIAENIEQIQWTKTFSMIFNSLIITGNIKYMINTPYTVKTFDLDIKRWLDGKPEEIDPLKSWW
jgi:hypothetical protein